MGVETGADNVDGINVLTSVSRHNRGSPDASVNRPKGINTMVKVGEKLGVFARLNMIAMDQPSGERRLLRRFVDPCIPRITDDRWMGDDGTQTRAPLSQHPLNRGDRTSSRPRRGIPI